MTRLKTLWAGVGVLALCGLVGAAVAVGAASKPKARAATTTGTTATRPARTPETPLTGDVLAQVKAAAIAKVGGTVDAATAENDGRNAAAAYEAHVTKADGTHVTVILDKSYTVLSVETGHGPGGPGGFGGGHRGSRPRRPGGPGNGETEVTGDTATKAIAAAVAKVGGTAEHARPRTTAATLPPSTRCT